MITPEMLKGVSAWMISQYPEQGARVAQALEQWLGGRVPYAYPAQLERHLEAACRELRDPRSEQKVLKLLFDAFYQVLPFGTGGRRGPVGYGPNRMNPSTVAMTIQGHCDYLRRVFGRRRELAVVVANDVRVFKDIAGTYKFLGARHPLLGVSSRSLGRLACSIYAANGIVAYFAKPRSHQTGRAQPILATPELSFLIRQLNAVGGINVSASHNPPDDNGVKVYDEYGSQPVAPNDQTLVEAMQDVAVQEMPFDEALRRGLVRELPQALHRKYLEAYVELFGEVYKPTKGPRIVYTPLCGCGLSTVGEAMTRLGFPWESPEDQQPDGTFAPIPFKAPNPEVPEATQPARDFADKLGLGLVLSSDPDADRVGMEAKQADGSWYHFDGNQIGAMLCYFLMLDPKGPRRKGLVIETLVTTRMLREIVRRSRGSKIIDDLLVGFKYVADVLKSLELRGAYRCVSGKVIRCAPKDLVLAAEESHGVIMLPTIRDKDATPACLYLAALYQRLHEDKRTPFDYYLQLLDELGGYDSFILSLKMRGAAGVALRDRMMKSLRERPPKQIGGQAVQRDVVDFWDEAKFGKFKSETDRLPRNVIRFATDNCTVTVRPSGTEPKIKLYCQLLPDTRAHRLHGLPLFASLRSRSSRLANAFRNDLLERVGLPHLASPTQLLPDIVEIEWMTNFQQLIVPQARQGLERGRWTSPREVLAWLRAETAPMVPGADPLPALKAPIALLCEEWSRQGLRSPLLPLLQEWSR